MDATSADHHLRELHRAIAQAARIGANYEWITGVLAGCLACEMTIDAARMLAVETLGRTVTPRRRPAA
jgi:hypothetical protein